jgi:hypothetical protein
MNQHSIVTQESNKVGRFNVLILTKDNHTNHYLSCELNYICLVPFEKTAEGTIKSIYVLEFPNKVTGQTVHSLIIDTVNPDLDKTPYDSVCRSLIEEAGLNIDSLNINENNIYYLGDIQMNVPMSLNIKCYGVDITSNDQLDFTRNLSKDNFIKDESSITKIGFHQVVNGEFPDTTILSGSFLLVSYFN